MRRRRVFKFNLKQYEAELTWNLKIILHIHKIIIKNDNDIVEIKTNLFKVEQLELNTVEIWPEWAKIDIKEDKTRNENIIKAKSLESQELRNYADQMETVVELLEGRIKLCQARIERIKGEIEDLSESITKKTPFNTPRTRA